jgi:hypothetical protein
MNKFEEAYEKAMKAAQAISAAEALGEVELPLPTFQQSPARLVTAAKSRTPSLSEIQSLVDQYQVIGHIAFIRPKLKQVSLDGGRNMSFAEAAAKMRLVLDRLS